MSASRGQVVARWTRPIQRQTLRPIPRQRSGFLVLFLLLPELLRA